MIILEHRESITSLELARNVGPFKRGKPPVEVYHNVTGFVPRNFVDLVNTESNSLTVMPTADGLVGEDYEARTATIGLVEELIDRDKQTILVYIKTD